MDEDRAKFSTSAFHLLPPLILGNVHLIPSNDLTKALDLK